MGVMRRLLLQHQWRLTAMEDPSIDAREAVVRMPHPPAPFLLTLLRRHPTAESRGRFRPVATRA
jgi:hypothetical protein